MESDRGVAEELSRFIPRVMFVGNSLQSAATAPAATSSTSRLITIQRLEDYMKS